MKKTYIIPTIAAVAIALALPVFTLAHDETDGGSDQAAASIEANRPKIAPGMLSESVKERLQAQFQQKVNNAKNNQDYRNAMVKKGNDQGDDNENDRRPTWNASSTSATSTKMWQMMHDREDKFKELMKERDDKVKSARAELFKFAKSHIIEQLQHALNNLKQIRSRIQSRIAKAEQSGRDMTKAKALLVTADAKFVVAQQSIDALSAFIPTISSTSTSATSTASTTVDLSKPRQLAGAATKAIKDARQALNAVVVEIAHSMGFKFGEDNDDRHGTTTTGTSTPPITGTTTPTTASTTTVISPSPSPSATSTPSPTPTATSTATTTNP